MNIIFLMIPVTLLLAGFFLISFVVMLRQGQWDDLETPAHRMLFEDEEAPPEA